jgi:invasion protein IalB
MLEGVLLGDAAHQVALHRRHRHGIINIISVDHHQLLAIRLTSPLGVFLGPAAVIKIGDHEHHHAKIQNSDLTRAANTRSIGKSLLLVLENSYAQWSLTMLVTLTHIKSF